jgi:perosamine synthetase
MIPLFRPHVGKEELKAIEHSFQTGWIGYGPKIKEFEDKFSAYTNARYSIGLNSATAALHLALQGLGIKAGDEVIIPALTFASTAHVVMYLNAVPVFADIREDTLCIDPEDIKRKLTPRTRAIIPVHYSGHPCEMDKILELAKERNLAVIEDAAQATGAEYRGRKIGSLESSATCFSFEAKKNLTTGEGGMLTTNNEELAKRVKLLRWVGIDKSTEARSRGKNYSWYYEVIDLGYKYHMNDIQAAMGIVQLSKLDQMNGRRREIVNAYNEAFSKVPQVTRPTEKDHVKSAYWSYVIQVDDRDGLIRHMNENGVSAGVHYMPIHMHPFYRKFTADVPVTERVWKRLVTLPLFVDLTDEDVQKVIETVRSFFK